MEYKNKIAVIIPTYKVSKDIAALSYTRNIQHRSRNSVHPKRVYKYLEETWY